MRKLNNILTIMLVIFFVLSFLMPIHVSLAASDDTLVYENLEYSVSSDGTITIKRLLNRETVTEIEIPAEIDGKPVVTLDSQFATPNQGEVVALKKISIPSTVQYVGSEYYGAFENVANLEEIIVDENNPYLCSIDGVLYNKDKTTLIVYPANKDAKTYNIPDGVTTIQCLAFGFAKNLEEVNIPNTVMTIQDSAFAQSSIKNLVIPESVEDMGSYVCYKCTNLEALEMNGSAYIDLKAFMGCEKLKTVNIGGDCTLIRGDAFRDCTSLENVNFETFNVISIEEEAFLNCPSLPRTIKMSDKIENLSKATFDSDVTLEFLSDDMIESSDEWNKCIEINVNGTQDYDEAYKVFDLVNEARRENNLNDLKLDKYLMDIAMQRAYEISVYFAHRRAEVYRGFNLSNPNQDAIKFFEDTIYQMGLTGRVMIYGENIAEYYNTAENVMKGWMNSDGHRANILGDFTTIGIGAVKVDNSYFWVQIFGINEYEQEAKRNNVTEQRKIPVCTSYIREVEGFTGITLYCRDVDILTGETAEVKAKSEFAYSDAITYLDNSNFKWSSSDESILTVDQNGIVTGVSAGNADVVMTLPTGQTRKLNFTVSFSAKKGDVNKDGKVALYDAFRILRYVILGGNELTPEQKYIMDYNSDGKIALYDAFRFLRQVILS